MDDYKSAIFIDSNAYLVLYETHNGKVILGLLDELHESIFVSEQIVNEVERNKIRVAAKFFAEKCPLPERIKTNLPVHFFDADGSILKAIRQKLDESNQKRDEAIAMIERAIADELQRISRSEDEVSYRLRSLFARAVAPSNDEIEKARKRKERGMAPGKKTDPLGDQLNWEQWLTAIKGRYKLWIISRDGDFCINAQSASLLNASLHRELVAQCGQSVEIHVFDRMDDGLNDFVKLTGKKPEKLPTPEQLEAFKEEQDALPPLDWLGNSEMDESTTAAVMANVLRRRHAAFHASSFDPNMVWHPQPPRKRGLIHLIGSPEAIPPPAGEPPPSPG